MSSLTMKLSFKSPFTAKALHEQCLLHCSELFPEPINIDLEEDDIATDFNLYPYVILLTFEADNDYSLARKKSALLKLYKNTISTWISEKVLNNVVRYRVGDEIKEYKESIEIPDVRIEQN